MNYKNFRLERKENIAVIVFERPDINNAMENPLFRIELTDILDKIIADPEAKVVILKNSGKFFCPGGNVKKMYADLTGENRESFLNEFKNDRIRCSEALIDLLYSMPKPIIASVNGVAAGGGANLALSCDFVFASERSSFIQSFININLIPDTGGLWTLANLVGIRKAKELAMTGDIVKAEEALAIGLINKVVPEEELDAVTMEFARKLASKPASALAEIKRVCSKLPELSRGAFIEMEAYIMTNLFAEEETVRRMGKFVNKSASASGK